MQEMILALPQCIPENKQTETGLFRHCPPEVAFSSQQEAAPPLPGGAEAFFERQCLQSVIRRVWPGVKARCQDSLQCERGLQFNSSAECAREVDQSLPMPTRTVGGLLHQGIDAKPQDIPALAHLLGGDRASVCGLTSCRMITKLHCCKGALGHSEMVLRLFKLILRQPQWTSDRQL